MGSFTSAVTAIWVGGLIVSTITAIMVIRQFLQFISIELINVLNAGNRDPFSYISF
jgi:hypothetical protein